MDAPHVNLATIVLDCRDANALADFYSRLLGWEITYREDDWVLMRNPDGGTGLSFQSEAWYEPPVWPEQEGHPTKMLHLDSTPPDIPSVCFSTDATAHSDVFERGLHREGPGSERPHPWPRAGQPVAEAAHKSPTRPPTTLGVKNVAAHAAILTSQSRSSPREIIMSSHRDLVIRSVRDGDGDDLAEVWDDGRAYYASFDADFFQPPDPDRPVDADAFVASLRAADEAPDRFSRVVEANGRVVGYVVARLDPPVPNAHEQLTRDLSMLRGYVETLGVHRSSWRRGIGRALMEAAEAWAHDQGAKVMKLDTNCRSSVSVPFYESLGYDREAIIFRKPL